MGDSGIFTAGYDDRRLLRDGGNRFARISCDNLFNFFFSGWKFTLFWSSQAGWYGGGVNESGVLGPDVESSGIAGVCAIPSMSRIAPRWAAAGDKCAIIVSTTGSVWTVGENFQRGWRELQLPPAFPARYEFVAVGMERFCLIPESGGGLVYTYPNSAPVYELPDVEFVDVAVGKRHFLGVSRDHRLYTWGHGKPCGQGRKWTSNVPKLVENFDHVSRVFAYSEISFVIDMEGRVFASGRNSHGQLGIGEGNRTNRFRPLAGFPEPIIHIAVGDDCSYFLLESGRVFATGSGEKYRLMINSENDVRVPKEVDMVEGRRFSWISAGCSSVVAQSGGRDILPHPFVMGSDRAVCPPYTVTINNQQVNIALGMRATLGCQPGEAITVNGQRLTFVGLAGPTRVLMTTETSGTTILSIAQFLAARSGSVKTRSGAIHGMRGGHDIAPFGVRVTETVRHVDFGEGTVAGVARGRLWIRWTGDSGITTGYNLDPRSLHARIEIVKPVARTVVRIDVDGAPANVEVQPCQALASFEIAVKDIVRRASGAVARVVGEFVGRAVIADVVSGRNELAPIGELAVVGRPGASAKRFMRDFAAEVVEVDLAFTEGAAVAPGARVLTEKGLATVVAADADGIWIQVDAATRLNAGLLRYTGPVKVVRAALAAERVGAFVAGDVVRARGRNWIVIDGALREVAGSEVIAEAEIADAAPVLVFRADLPASVELAVGKGLKAQFSVSSVDFRGKRVFPGDLIELTNRQFVIAGYHDEAVWIQPVDDEGTLLAVQAQALLDPDFVKIIAFVDGGIKYRGE